MGKITEQQQWEEDVYLIEKQDKVLGGELGVINIQAKQLANRTKYLKYQVDGINRDRTGYAPKASPAFTGVPTAPTADQNTNNAQIATTEFVKNAIAALVGSAPAALDTLEELARALAGDANLKATLLAEIGKKANSTDFNALHDLFIGIPIPYPLSTVPEGCLSMNGQRFDKSRYPKLALKYTSGTLPDMRGEFIRGLDNGRGVDAGRGLLSNQGDAIRNITGEFSDFMYQDEQSLSGTLTATGAIYRDLNIRDISATAAPSKILPQGDKIKFDASRVVPTANENRPRNIAYHYICLAA
ncbi:phage tail protein [Haemophilus sp. 27098_8_127]|uniref:phage tail protein n=1 Tax=Haemophilus sp. 27098_8_127 TaxID=3003684 RepID=UPI00352CD8D8